MERVKWVGKWILSWIVFVIIYSIGGILFPLSAEITAKIGINDGKYMILALVVVTASLSFFINYIISSSQSSGLKLYGAMLVLTWGIQTFMTQVETIVFIKAFPDLDIFGVSKIMMSQLFIFVLYLPLPLLLHGRWKKQDEKLEKIVFLKPRWFLWIPVIIFVYVLLYFYFGLFPMSFQATKEYYASWISSTDAMGGLKLFFIQVIRSILWLLCILPLFFIMKGSKEKKIVLSGIVMSVFASFQLLFPNGLMPPIVRFGHFVEVFSEMLIFGALVAWMIVPEDKNK